MGDELRNVPGGDAYANSGKLFLHPYDADRILISQRDQLLTLYDGKEAVPFPTEADDYLTNHKPYTSTLLADGSFCVTTLNGGAVIIGHDGKLRQIIDEGAGLLDSNTLSAYQDREGALWLGLMPALLALKSILRSRSSRSKHFRRGPVQRVDLCSSGGGNAAVQRMVFDPKTGHPSLVPLRGSTQAFTLGVQGSYGQDTRTIAGGRQRRCYEGGGRQPGPCDAGCSRPQ